MPHARKDIFGNWRLHHNNVPSHTAFLVPEYLAKDKVATLPQLPYSPDVALLYFFLFPRIKRSLKGKHFGTLDDVKEPTTRCLNEVPIDTFQEAYCEWQRH